VKLQRRSYRIREIERGWLVLEWGTTCSTAFGALLSVRRALRGSSTIAVIEWQPTSSAGRRVVEGVIAATSTECTVKH
jgi:hypothetical protein